MARSNEWLYGMHRRAYLGVLGGVIGGGCVSAPPNEDSPPARTDGRNPATADPVTFDPNASVRTVSVGTRSASEPHHLTVRNATSGTRRIALAIRTGRSIGERAVLDESYDLPADSALSVRLLEPATYRITLRLVGTGQTKRWTVERRSFDCNRKSTTVTLAPDGNVTTVRTSTMAECDP